MSEEKTASSEAPEADSFAKFEALEQKLGITEESDTPTEDVVEDTEEPEAEAEEHPEPSDADKDDTAVANPKEFEKALAALRRDKVPQSHLDALDDPSLIAWGLERAKVQAEADKVFSELGQLKAERESAEAETQEPEAQSAEGQPTVFDLAEAGQPLSEHFSEDEASAFMGVVQAALGQATAGMAERDQRIANLQGQLENVLLNDSMRQLEGRFPGLAEQANRDAVRAKIGVLDVSTYESVSDIVLDASRLAGLEDQAKSASDARDSDLSRRKDAGTTRNSQARVGERKSSKADQQFSKFLELEANLGLTSQ